jgi:hypothetical protein
MKQTDSSIIIVRNFVPMIADDNLVKKGFGPVIADHDLVKKR